MNRIDRCSFCIVEKVTKDSQSHSSDLDTEIQMAEFGKKVVGTHYDQQLGYGYREIEQGSTIRLKQYKKVVLMDKVSFMPSQACII